MALCLLGVGVSLVRCLLQKVDFAFIKFNNLLNRIQNIMKYRRIIVKINEMSCNR